MTDATVCYRQTSTRIGEDFTHFAHVGTVEDSTFAIVHRHTSAFLSTVLQGAECQGEITTHINALLLVVPGINTHYSTGIVWTLHCPLLLTDLATGSAYPQGPYTYP